MHVHVEKAEKYAKFWMKPISFYRNNGFNSSELKTIEEILEKYQTKIEEKWNEYFRNG